MTTATPGISAFATERRNHAGSPVCGVLVYGNETIAWRIDLEEIPSSWTEKASARVRLPWCWVSFWGAQPMSWWMRHAETIGDHVRGLAWSHNGRQA